VVATDSDLADPQLSADGCDASRAYPARTIDPQSLAAVPYRGAWRELPYHARDERTSIASQGGKSPAALLARNGVQIRAMMVGGSTEISAFCLPECDL
jgi:hypothetical protein